VGGREAKRRFKFLPRRATSRFRALPDFIIIGAMKAGTSSLYQCLMQHPQIVPPFQKEIHFFDGHFNRGEQWYRAHFPLQKRLESGFITCEASPEYLFIPSLANRISELLPDVKLIAMLRNPTERAISHYYHKVRERRETLPLFEALLAEDDRIGEGPRDDELMDPDFMHFFYKKSDFMNFSYKKRGLYKEQLDRFWQVFSRDQVLVLNSDEFFREPLVTVSAACRFLEIDEEFVPGDLKPVNVGYNREKIDPAVYEYLNDFFDPHNQALYGVLGRDLCW
jgi:hypothetical protein